jgi:hypothetical protein
MRKLKYTGLTSNSWYKIFQQLKDMTQLQQQKEIQ